MRRLLVLLAALALVALAACGGETEPATDVTHDAATLNGLGFCDGSESGEYWYELRRAGGAFAQVGSRVAFQCSGATVKQPLQAVRAGGLAAQTGYEFRLCASSGEAQGCRDADGADASNYDRFTTTAPPSQGCTKTVGPGASASAAFAGVGSGAKVCLTAGSYNWGDFNIPAGVTLQGAQDVGEATVTGEAHLQATGSTLSDVNMAAGADHAVVDLRGSSNTVQFVDVHGGNKAALFQGIIASGDGNRILDSVIHDVSTVSSPDATRNHAIYWSGGRNGLIDRVWMYRVSGYGLHFYGPGNVDGTVADHTVYDDGLTGRGHVKNIGGTLTLRNSVVTDAGPLSCPTPLAVTNVRDDRGGCGSTAADTAYADEPGRDYGNPTSGFFTPGPRW